VPRQLVPLQRHAAYYGTLAAPPSLVADPDRQATDFGEGPAHNRLVAGSSPAERMNDINELNRTLIVVRKVSEDRGNIRGNNMHGPGASGDVFDRFHPVPVAASVGNMTLPPNIP
jgi:hypothetical protein